MRVVFWFLFFSSCLLSCDKHKVDNGFGNAENDISKIFNFTNVEIAELKTEVDTVIIINVNLGKAIDNETGKEIGDTLYEDIASVAALVFVLATDSVLFKNCNNLKVKFVNTTCEYSYSFDTLSYVSKLFLNCDKFCKNLVEKKYIENVKYLNYDLKNQIKRGWAFSKDFIVADEKYGEIESYKIVGFKILDNKYQSSPKFKVVKFEIELYRSKMKVNNLDLEFGYPQKYSGITRLDF